MVKMSCPEMNSYLQVLGMRDIASLIKGGHDRSRLVAVRGLDSKLPRISGAARAEKYVGRSAKTMVKMSCPEMNSYLQVLGYKTLLR